MTISKRNTADRAAMRDKHYECFPDRSRKKAADPSCRLTTKNPGTRYAPSHNRTDDPFFEGEATGVVFLRGADKKKKKGEARSGKLLALIIIVMFFASVSVAAYFLMVVDSVLVTGVSDDAVRRIIELSGIETGSHILSVDLKKAKAAIESDPYFKVNRIEREYPSKIVIEAGQRREAASIEYMDVNIIIDNEGYVLFIGKRDSTEGLIKVEGLRLSGCQVNRSLGETPDIFIYTLLEVLGALKDEDFLSSIKTLEVSNPLDIRMTAINELHIVLGEADRLSEKLESLKEVMPELERRGLLNGILDLSIKGAPVYSPAPQESEDNDPGEGSGQEGDD
ncbi:MAG: Cell division protein FtsQ [Firmicutes bacterium ADurb.Bin182]|nr:MAG: Cell division protein FtsQ [Firmicutes bacterium ADurb.Bin182]